MTAGLKKRCGKCKTEQSTLQFYKNRKSSDGLQAWCKLCSNDASKFNQGMKRAEKSELRALLQEDEKCILLEAKALKDRFDLDMKALALKYSKGKTKIISKVLAGDSNANQ